LKNKEFVDIDELLPDKEAVGKEEKEKQSDVKYLTSDKKKDKKREEGEEVYAVGLPYSLPRSIYHRVHTDLLP
jgi:hypothetical protein